MHLDKISSFKSIHLVLLNIKNSSYFKQVDPELAFRRKRFESTPAIAAALMAFRNNQSLTS